MQVKIFDNLNDLNSYLKDKKAGNLEVQRQAFVVGQSLDRNGQKIFEIVDRYMVIEK